MDIFRFQSLLRSYLLCSFVSQVISIPAPLVLEQAPVITMASGVVIGTTTKPANQPFLTAHANAYLGIPFAKSPPERFSPPQPASSWSTPLQAQKIKPACIQQFPGMEKVRNFTMLLFDNPLGPPLEESEDCLYVNIHTPRGITSASKKAVLFWLYGGNLAFGSGGFAFYDGSSLAITQDVVVVTFNYRTNIFGFSNSPEISHGSQNAGFLDQRFALQWVQDNIAEFGGDPCRVTIFGESAGGESVKQLLANPPEPLPFSSAILQSQNAVIVGNGLTNYEKVLSHYNCTNATSPIACLRQISAVDIKAYIESKSLAFPPVDADGTSMKDVRASIMDRTWADVPVLIGSTLNESRFIVAAGDFSNGTAAINAIFTSIVANSSVERSLVMAKYAAEGIIDLFDVAMRVATDFVFTCTTSSLATFLAGNGFITYRYRYDGIFPSVSIYDNAGAYHTSEIPQVFGTYPLSNQFGNATQQQVKLSAFMQKTWADFAKNSSANVGWPSIGSAKGHELGVFGANGSSGLTVRHNLEFDYPCALYLTAEDERKVSY